MREPLESELEALEEELRSPLSRYMTKSPKTEETKSLIQRLQPEFDLIQAPSHAFELSFNEKIRRPSLFKQLVSQLQTYQKAFWLVSILVFVMLTLMSGVNNSTLFMSNDLFSISVPIFLLSSFTYSYRSWNKEMRMVESITPFPPAVLLLSRLLIVIGLNAGLGLVGSLYLSWAEQSVRFLPFLINWLAPLFFIGGVLAHVMFRRGVMVGMSTSLLGWGLWISCKGWLFNLELRRIDYVLWGIETVLLVAGILLLFTAYRRLSRQQVALENVG